VELVMPPDKVKAPVFPAIEDTDPADAIDETLAFFMAEAAASQIGTSSLAVGLDFNVNPSMVTSVGVALPLVLLTLNVHAAIVAILAFVTALAAMVVALPTLVTSPVEFAFVVTLPAVRLDAVPVSPVPAPVNDVLERAPVEGLNVNLVLVTLSGRLPVFVVTHTTSIAAFVAASFVIAEFVALVAVVDVVALPANAAVTVPAEKFPEPSLDTSVLTVFAVATAVPVGNAFRTGADENVQTAEIVLMLSRKPSVWPLVPVVAVDAVPISVP
jgi:hypothetical protein